MRTIEVKLYQFEELSTEGTLMQHEPHGYADQTGKGYCSECGLKRSDPEARHLNVNIINASPRATPHEHWPGGVIDGNAPSLVTVRSCCIYNGCGMPYDMPIAPIPNPEGKLRAFANRYCPKHRELDVPALVFVNEPPTNPSE